MTRTFATTGIGSLPFTDEQEAVDHVFEHYTIPFYPQLVKHPRYAGNAAPQMLQEALPKKILEALLTSKPSAGSIDALETNWNNLLSEHLKSLPGLENFRSHLMNSNGSFYKLQLVGPLTAQATLEYLTGSRFDERLSGIFSRMLILTAKKLIDFTSTPGRNCIFIWDEGVPLSGTDTSRHRVLQLILQALESPKVIAGVHTCAPFNIESFVRHASGRFIAPDVGLLDRTSSGQSSAIRDVFQVGGLIGGVVDTRKTTIDRSETIEKVQWIKETLKDVPRVQSSLPAVLSGACGTGLHTPAYERELASTLKTIVQSPEFTDW